MGRTIGAGQSDECRDNHHRAGDDLPEPDGRGEFSLSDPAGLPDCDPFDERDPRASVDCEETGHGEPPGQIADVDDWPLRVVRSLCFASGDERTTIPINPA